MIYLGRENWNLYSFVLHPLPQKKQKKPYFSYNHPPKHQWHINNLWKPGRFLSGKSFKSSSSLFLGTFSQQHCWKSYFKSSLTVQVGMDKEHTGKVLQMVWFGAYYRFCAVLLKALWRGGKDYSSICLGLKKKKELDFGEKKSIFRSFSKEFRLFLKKDKPRQFVWKGTMF